TTSPTFAFAGFWLYVKSLIVIVRAALDPDGAVAQPAAAAEALAPPPAAGDGVDELPQAASRRVRAVVANATVSRRIESGPPVGDRGGGADVGMMVVPTRAGERRFRTGTPRIVGSWSRSLPQTSAGWPGTRPEPTP